MAQILNGLAQGLKSSKHGYRILNPRVRDCYVSPRVLSGIKERLGWCNPQIATSAGAGLTGRSPLSRRVRMTGTRQMTTLGARVTAPEKGNEHVQQRPIIFLAKVLESLGKSATVGRTHP